MTNKPRAQRAVEGAPLAGIEHIVVVMFENRSFDNVLGALYPPSDGYWGVSPDLSNTYKKHFWDQSQTVYVTQTPPSGHPPTITPYPDPGESFDDMTAQIFGDPNTGVANMSGFAQNYCDLGLATRDPGDIMFYFKPEQMQVSNLLAGWFAVCDQWFASGPVQTFPNRMFCHCATPSTWRPVGFLEARVNDTDYLSDFTSSGSVTDTSVFQLLDGNSGVPDPANWKVYFHDTPMSALNAYVNDAFNAESPCLSSFDDSDYDPPHGTTFADDVLADTLPTYAFIEPRYFDNHGGREGLPPNSNHPGGSDYLGVTGPPIDVTNGELLLADICLALFANPEVYAKTLLIVTYDEHGGLYDHVPPNTAPFAPKAVSPFVGEQPGNFDYTRFGVRVPTFFVNRRIAREGVYRPPRPESGPYYPFDHTSIIATLCAQFGLAGPLTPRDAAAPILSGLVTTAESETFDPPPLEELSRWRASAVGDRKANPQPPLSPAEHDRRLTAWVRAKAQPRTK